MLEKFQISSLIDDALNQIAWKRKGGNELVYFCPKCHHYKRKLEVCMDESSKFFGAFNCWVCHESGNLYRLMNFSNNPIFYKSKLKLLLKNVKLTYIPANSSTAPNILSLPPGFCSLSKSKNTPEYKNAINYLKKRRVTLEDILRYNMGYSEDEGCDYRFHIIIPSYDSIGNLNFFIGRRYYATDGAINYKKPEVPMDSIIGFECFINWSEPVSLCEGAFDAIAIRNNGIPLFGKFPSKKLREKLIVSNATQVNMVLDDDAFSDSVKNYELFKREIPGITINMVKLPGKDPSKLGFLKTHQIIRNSKEFDESDLMEYKMNL